MNFGFAVLIVDHFDVMPADAHLKPRTQGFDYRLFGGKASSKMTRSIIMTATILNFSR